MKNTKQLIERLEKITGKQVILKEDSAGFGFLVKDKEVVNRNGKKHLLKKGTRVTDESNGWVHIWRAAGTTFQEDQISETDIDGFHI